MIRDAPGLASRFGAFVAERHPFALADAIDAFEAIAGGRDAEGEAAIDALRPRCGASSPDGWGRTASPGICPTRRRARPRTPASSRRSPSCVDACDGFLRRAAIEASLTPRRAARDPARHGADARHRQPAEGVLHERRGPLRRIRRFRARASVRSGQEAIYAAAIRLRRGAAYRGADGRWTGDVIAPVIRDLGVALAMRPEPATVRMVLNAQMGKAGPPFDGKDLHIGDFEWGILPPAAPLGDRRR